MKIYAITHFIGSKQRRVIVAAKSKASAVRALNAHGLSTSMHYFNGWGSESGNGLEREVTMAQPGRVFHTDINNYARTAEQFTLLPLKDGYEAER